MICRRMAYLPLDYMYAVKKDNEKTEIFKKIEPYSTFLNVLQLERQRAEFQTKIEEELQYIN